MQIAIAFPYRRDGKLVSCKYRDIDKKFWQVVAISDTFFFFFFNLTQVFKRVMVEMISIIYIIRVCRKRPGGGGLYHETTSLDIHVSISLVKINKVHRWPIFE